MSDEPTQKSPPGNGYTLGYLAAKLDDVIEMSKECRDEIRKLPCRDRSGIVPASCPVPRLRTPSSEQPRTPTGQSYKAVKEQLEEFESSMELLEDKTAQRAREEAHKAALLALDERLALVEKARSEVRSEQKQQQEERRGFVRYVVDLLKTAGPAVVAIVVALGVRCEMQPQNGRAYQQVQQQQQQTPASRPAKMR